MDRPTGFIGALPANNSWCFRLASFSAMVASSYLPPEWVYSCQPEFRECSKYERNAKCTIAKRVGHTASASYCLTD
eukprot:scaffold284638_cov32-Tisochrysis_lutea.AAC.2